MFTQKKVIVFILIMKDKFYECSWWNPPPLGATTEKYTFCDFFAKSDSDFRKKWYHHKEQYSIDKVMEFHEKRKRTAILKNSQTGLWWIPPPPRVE